MDPDTSLSSKEESDILGRAMVIHDFTGGRIACGIIGEVQLGTGLQETSLVNKNSWNHWIFEMVNGNVNTFLSTPGLLVYA